MDILHLLDAPQAFWDVVGIGLFVMLVMVFWVILPLIISSIGTHRHRRPR